MALLLIGLVGFSSCNNDDDDDSMTPANDIFSVLAADPDYSILVDALEKTGLDEFLALPAQFTLFAPKDPAFQAFLDAAGTGSVANTPADVLNDVLTYHVIGSERKAADLETGYYETGNITFPGNNQIATALYINVDNGVVLNGQAEVVDADIDASNGVIHEIDEVINLATVVTFAANDPNFSLLAAALTTPGLPTDFLEVLSGDGPFSVFAPTNAAFEALLLSNPDWDTPADIPSELLDTVLKYHVTDAGNVRSTDLTDGMSVPTLAGVDFSIDLSGDVPVINAGSNTANIIATDVQAKNGVIHVIDTVILP